MRVRTNEGSQAGACTLSIDLGTRERPIVVRELLDLTSALLRAGQVLDEANAPDDRRWVSLPRNAYTRDLGQDDRIAGFFLVRGGEQYGVQVCSFAVEGATREDWGGRLVLDFKDPSANAEDGSPLEMVARAGYEAWNHSVQVATGGATWYANWDKQDEKVRERFRAVAAAVLDTAGVDPRGIDPEPAVPHDFGWALKQLKEGRKVQRAGWNGKGMYVYLHKSFIKPDPAGRHIYCEPCLVMYTAQGKHQPGWTISPADALAGDWDVVE